jgi:hypothetical protein
MTHEQTDMEALERIVELHGLRSTLAMLANVCAEKVTRMNRPRRIGARLTSSFSKHTTRCPCEFRPMAGAAIARRP